MLELGFTLFKNKSVPITIVKSKRAKQPLALYETRIKLFKNSLMNYLDEFP